VYKTSIRLIGPLCPPVVFQAVSGPKSPPRLWVTPSRHFKYIVALYTNIWYNIFNMSRSKHSNRAPKAPFSFRRNILPPLLGIVAMLAVFGLLNSQLLVAEA